MKILTQAFFTDIQKEGVYKLWNEEYPQKLQFNDLSEFETYLDSLLNLKHYLLLDEQDKIVGWSVTFMREDQKWFAIILSSTIHGKGYGTMLLNEVRKNENSLIGWVIDHERDTKANGHKYNSPLNFYTKNHFKVHEDCRIESEKLSAVKIEWNEENGSKYPKSI